MRGTTAEMYAIYILNKKISFYGLGAKASENYSEWIRQDLLSNLPS